MKRWIFILTLALLGASVSALAREEDGIDRGNPGDEYAAAFINIGYDLAENLAKDPIPGVEARALFAAVRATSLHSEASLKLRGYEVDAINYPHSEAPRIVVSRAGWDRMGLEPHRRVFLVLHEYLAIMGIDDSKYQVSSLLDRAKVCNRHPVVRQVIERELKKSCYRIIQDDLLYVTDARLSDANITSLKKSDFAGLLGLESLYLQGNDFQHIDRDFFGQFPKLKTLATGWAVANLDDCSLFEKMPRLNSFAMNYTSYDSHPEWYRPLPVIAPGCFASLKRLYWLSISLDGSRSSYAGFLKGIRSRFSVQLNGNNLDKISVNEFAGLDLNSVEFLTYDHPMPAAYLTAVTEILGYAQPCRQYENVNNGIRVYSASCVKY